MMYDPLNPLHAESARMYLEKLLSGNRPFEIIQKRQQRSISQNSYLHLIIAYLACSLGESVDYVKREYYKKAANADLFIRKREDVLLRREVPFLRSSRDLSVEEMSMSIERFKHWSAKEACIVLPDADDERQLIAAQLEIDRYKRNGYA